MKKILLSLALISILAVLVLPIVADAQVPEAQLSQCCKIKNPIKVGKDPTTGADIIIGKGAVIGPSDATYCEYTDPTTAPTSSTGWVTNEDWGGICLMNSISVITDWVFYLFMALTVVFIILGAVTFMAAAGDPEKATKGKRFITYAVIGVVLGLLAKALPAIVRGVIGF